MLQHVVVLFQELDGVVNQIVKVHGVGSKAPTGILLVHLGGLSPSEIAGGVGTLPIFGGGDPLVLCAADLRKDRPGDIGLLVQLHVLQDVLHQAETVRGIVDGKAAGVAQALRVTAQDAHAGRVEGAGPDVVRLLPQHQAEPLLELPRRLVGKGDREDTPRSHRIQRGEASGLFPARLQQSKRFFVRLSGYKVRVPRLAVAQELGDPVDEHSGLAAARPRQDQQRPLRCQHSLLLHGIEGLKIAQDQLPARLFILLFKSIHHKDNCITFPCPGQAG